MELIDLCRSAVCRQTWNRDHGLRPVIDFSC